ncbi:hypothetical protein NQ176_g6247 [Zarea fungicola]|uniref:Uncharacterized protein n=1 Tax=Zarea fungicola TaxID=93591 RepID=A0ACC1N5A1_9HYPO|nr:hypothetical protein NQ176_g6247 [Lecanicillium fungicola]
MASIVGCLLDVSGSMKTAIKPLLDHKSDGKEETRDRLQAILTSTLNLAQAQEEAEPGADMFIGVFGLNADAGYPPFIDLCSAIDSLGIHDDDNTGTGHERLVLIASQNNRAYIERYIKSKLTDAQANIIAAHLKKHPSRIKEFVECIPNEEEFKKKRSRIENAGRFGGAAAGARVGLVAGPIGFFVGGVVGHIFGSTQGSRVADAAAEWAVADSEALRMAKDLCKDWLHEHTELTPRSAAEVVRMLKIVQSGKSKASTDQSDASDGNSTLLDTLRGFMYGRTPMCEALRKAQVVFQRAESAQQKLLITISDGEATDGDPLPVCETLKENNVLMATIYLSTGTACVERKLYAAPEARWDNGRRKMFAMASSVVSCAGPVARGPFVEAQRTWSHLIAGLASVEWDIPSSGVCSLFAIVSTELTMNELCSVLHTIRSSTTDALLDLVGRIELDCIINDQNVRTIREPSDQEGLATCYAHAVAAVAHMALHRIHGREGGYPSVEEIRNEILAKFPPNSEDGYSCLTILESMRELYRPLQYREVDEDGARQALLRRRPVLATFDLSKSGWDEFGKFFEPTSPMRSRVLSQKRMERHWSEPTGIGHAVVLYSCAPESLTFLNSWGENWGYYGTFSIQNHNVLSSKGYPMEFYDVMWYEKGLTAGERKAYDRQSEEIIRSYSRRIPELLELEEVFVGLLAPSALEQLNNQRE